MISFVCSATGNPCDAPPPAWHSPDRAPLDLDFVGQVRPNLLADRPPTLWRYREALPLPEDAPVVTLGEGCTPLVPIDLAGRTFHAKLDFLMPTGSYKDRGSSLLLSWLKAHGAPRVIDDSSGNAGASIACYAARAGIPCEIYVPADNSPGKLVQIQMYGARLVRVDGNREVCGTACQQAVGPDAWYASHVWNPYFIHGCKTFVYELFEQRGGSLPDAIIFPVGNGALLLGACLAQAELEQAGRADRRMRLIAVQAENCAPLAAAFHERVPGEIATTAAEGIAVTAPPRARQIVDAIRATGGDVCTVTETEIRDATLLAARMGLCIEPTSAAAIAAALAHPPAGDVVLALTGSGLKATAKLAGWVQS